MRSTLKGLGTVTYRGRGGEGRGGEGRGGEGREGERRRGEGRDNMYKYMYAPCYYVHQ